MEIIQFWKGPQLGLSGTIQSWEVKYDGSIDGACYKPHSNLITNYGLESFHLNYGGYADVTRYIVGTGTAS